MWFKWYFTDLTLSLWNLTKDHHIIVYIKTEYSFFSNAELKRELDNLDKVSCFPKFPDPEEEFLGEDELKKIDKHTADIVNIAKQISDLSSEE